MDGVRSADGVDGVDGADGADSVDRAERTENGDDSVDEPRVLVIGLDPYRVPGPWDPAPVADAIATGMAFFADAGVGVQSCLVGLDGSDDIDAVIAAALGSREWEVVVVGGGIRTAEDQLDVFERVVNLVHRLAPGAAIAFNRTPSDTYAAAARWLTPYDA